HDNPFLESDVSRGSESEDLQVEARFFLTPEEVEAAALPKPSWFIVRKAFEGTRSFEIIPPPPKRDLTSRAILWQALNSAIQSQRLMNRLDEDAEEALTEAWPDISELLQSEAEEIDDGSIDPIEEHVEVIADAAIASDAAKIRKIRAHFE